MHEPPDHTQDEAHSASTEQDGLWTLLLLGGLAAFVGYLVLRNPPPEPRQQAYTPPPRTGGRAPGGTQRMHLQDSQYLPEPEPEPEMMAPPEPHRYMLMGDLSPFDTQLLKYYIDSGLLTDPLFGLLGVLPQSLVEPAMRARDIALGHAQPFTRIATSLTQQAQSGIPRELLPQLPVSPSSSLLVSARSALPVGGLL